MSTALTPAQVNRIWAAQEFKGSLGIFTIVSGWYQWYLPMFLNRLKHEMPEAVPLVYVRGKIELPEPWASQCRQAPELELYPPDGFTTAALRYVYENAEMRDFDYLHITDADMLIMAEMPNMVNQHMRHLKRYQLECYDNYVVSHHDLRPKCPGVHFVTKDWWERTNKARTEYAADLLKNGSHSWEWDELMLGRIIQDSGLRLSMDPFFWAHHGVHLGDWRRRLQKGHQYPPPEASHQLYIQRLLRDKEFMEVVDLCAPKIEKLRETFDLFKTV